jgi:hypothetical protein
MRAVVSSGHPGCARSRPSPSRNVSRQAISSAAGSIVPSPPPVVVVTPVSGLASTGSTRTTASPSPSSDDE